MKVLIATLSIALLACEETADGESAARGALPARVANWYDNDCRAAAAPTPKAVKDLDQLCSCMRTRILATVRDGDQDAVVNKKIDEGAQACLREVYPH